MDHSTLAQDIFLAIFGLATFLLLFCGIRAAIDMWRVNRDFARMNAEISGWEERLRALHAEATPGHLTEKNKDFLEEATRDL